MQFLQCGAIRGSSKKSKKCLSCSILDPLTVNSREWATNESRVSRINRVPLETSSRVRAESQAPIPSWSESGRRNGIETQLSARTRPPISSVTRPIQPTPPPSTTHSRLLTVISTDRLWTHAYLNYTSAHLINNLQTTNKMFLLPFWRILPIVIANAWLDYTVRLIFAHYTWTFHQTLRRILTTPLSVQLFDCLALHALTYLCPDDDLYLERSKRRRL